MNEATIDILLLLSKTTVAGAEEEYKEKIRYGINQLLLYNFEGLVQLLYRLDISEQQLKNTLALHQGTDTAIIITDLILQRQQQKTASRRAFQKSNDIPPDEAW